MQENNRLAAALAHKAEHDWKAARVGFEHDAPLDTVCFHLQQVAEKLLKALLASRNVDHPLTHNLAELLGLTVAEFPVLEPFTQWLPAYTVFAVQMRYDDSIALERDQVQSVFDVIARFRSLAHALLPPEARPGA